MFECPASVRLIAVKPLLTHGFSVRLRMFRRFPVAGTRPAMSERPS